MRQVSVVRSANGITVYIGEVSPSGNYVALPLTESEAVLVMERIRAVLIGESGE